MAFWALRLEPYGKRPVTVPLRQEEPVPEEKIRPAVFADRTYEFTLIGDEVSRVQNIFVFVNDLCRPSVFHEGKICFGNARTEGMLFLDCYGYVELELVAELEDDTRIRLYSDYLPVLVRKGGFHETVRKMVHYVYDNREDFLFNGQPKLRGPGDLKQNGRRSLEAVLILAGQIARAYENGYGYFKANSRFHTKKVPAVEDLERIQSITPATLGYIVSHPEELRQVNSSRGIAIGNCMYQPRKTLTIQNVYSYDIYENRVLLDFLKTVIRSIEEMKQQCEKLLGRIPDKKIYDTEYVYSPFLILSQTGKMLEEGKEKLSALHKKLTRLYEMYSKIYRMTGNCMSGPPKATPVFMHVPGYNRMFAAMHQWFCYGIYSFEAESFMLSFADISSVYESYLLIKLGKYFESRGYVLEEERKCQYPVPEKWKYKNTVIPNTFVYSRGGERITLYYQPVIYDTDQRSVNGIGLYRNNSILLHSGTVEPEETEGYYYTPDYLIKIEEKGKRGDRYLILDAKFSSILNVKKYYVKDLAFKYLFSTSTVSPEDSVAGMCVLYGKCKKEEQPQSVYNRNVSGRKTAPLAELLPLMEESTEVQQQERLDMLFSMLGEELERERGK